MARTTEATCNRFVYLAGACFQALFTSVIIYGFPQLSSVLADEGVYADQCSAGDELPCDEQLSSINFLFVVASSLTLCSSLLLNGWVMDLFGIKVAALVANALMITAFSILAATAFGSISEAGWLVGFVILGSSAIGQLHTLYSVSNLFSDRPTLILGIINGCADGSALLFLVFRSIYESGVELGAIFVGYIVGPLLITTCLALFLWPRWPLVPATPPSEDTDKPEHDAAAAKGGWSTAAAPALGAESSEQENTAGDPASSLASSKVAGSDAASTKNTEEEAGAVVLAPEHAGAEAEHNDAEEQLDAGSDATAASVPEIEPDTDAATQAEVDASGGEGGGAATPIATKEGDQPATLMDSAHPYMGLALKEQAASPVYLGLAAFSVVSLFKFSFYLAAFDLQADFLGQEDGEYTRILGIVMSCAIAVVPIVGLGIDRFGLHNAVAANFALSVGVSIVTLIPNLEIQAFGTVLFLVFRGFVFTVLSGCLAAEFGFANFGALIGAVSFVAGLLGLLISPLFDLSLNTFDGDFTVANGIIAVFTLLLQAPFTWYYWRYRKARDALAVRDAATAAGEALPAEGACDNAVAVSITAAPAEEAEGGLAGTAPASNTAADNSDAAESDAALEECRTAEGTQEVAAASKE